jgi:protein tyrosine/serine phosphatase
MNERALTWEGCINARDLGGLKTIDGRVTCRGAVVRSDTPSRLTAAGWSALYNYGIRTIITLRTYGMVEEELNVSPPYADVAVVQAEIEDITDREFVDLWVTTSLWGTPLYFADALRRWPERHAAVVSAVAQAQPGGVLFHCIRGYDRTGIIALLLLALVGVTPDEISADYELSVDAVRDQYMAREHTSVLEVISSTLDGLDVDRYLIAGGASPADLSAVRQRLLG